MISFWRHFVAVAGACLLVTSSFAQIPADPIKSRIEAVHYLFLAEMARVQGDVRISVHSEKVTVLSGHPLLVQVARQATASLVPVMGLRDSEFTWHFVLTDSTTKVINSRIVKKGNAFERVILRALGLKTEKVLTEYECREGNAPPNNFRINGASIEIWIFGTSHCPMTNSSTLVARR